MIPIESDRVWLCGLNPGVRSLYLKLKAVIAGHSTQTSDNGLNIFVKKTFQGLNLICSKVKTYFLFSIMGYSQ